RVYALGVPLAIKLGNLKERKFIFAGGGADLALNYKEKGFVNRGDKTKFHEWFSDRTPALMPYLFVGASVDPGLTLKVQYYPGNFLNPEFTPRSGLQPYAGYHVHLFFVSLGVDLHYNTLPRKAKVNYSTGCRVMATAAKGLPHGYCNTSASLATNAAP